MDRNYKRRHLTFFLCICKPSVWDLILFVQKCFAMVKKKYNIWLYSRIGEGQPLFPPFFSSAYCNCPYLFIRRGRNIYIYIFDVRQKKNLSVRTSALNDIRLDMCATSLDCVYSGPSVHCVCWHTGLVTNLLLYLNTEPLLSTCCNEVNSKRCGNTFPLAQMHWCRT